MKKVGLFLSLLLFSFSVSAKTKVTLINCIDGDTAKFKIDGEVKTVRFLSIDAPEIAHDEVEAEPYGDEASDFTCNALKNASSIKLQYDPKSDKVDKYDRVLAWIFIDDKLLQEDLVSNGLAEVRYVYDDYLYSSKLKDLENKSKEKKVGMWSDVKRDYVVNIDMDYIFYFGVTVFMCIVCFILKRIIFKRTI